jgi:hypothetical protein
MRPAARFEDVAIDVELVEAGVAIGLQYGSIAVAQ